MSDWFFKQGGRDKLVDWLSIDSVIDSTVAETWAHIKDYWNAGTSFFQRFRLTGWKRLLNELACESLTLAAVGTTLLYALSLPALLDFDEEKFLTGRYAVKFLDRHGNEIGDRGILHDDAVPLEDIPESMIKSALATEDRRFFEHFGVDFQGTTRALIENMRAQGVVQGGSTLTQQLAKNLFLTSERSITRKVKEVYLAFLLESRLSKREILKLYLDRAYMGGGAFGVEAAAQFYFGKSIRRVNLAEAAMLAGLFKAPTKYAPHVNLPASRARTNEVLSNLVEAGFYTSAEVHQARLHPAKIIENRNLKSPEWYLDWAFEEVARLAKGKGEFVLTARTTVDLTLQRQAEEALVNSIRREGRSQRVRNGALVSMETDGAVRAMVGGTDYGRSQFNRAAHARRQPGSSFKPYVYAVALENGYTPKTVVRDWSRSCGRWHPKNYGGGHGSGSRITLSYALAKSKNTTAVELSLKFGRDKVMELVQRLGVTGIRKSCSMALGDGGVTVLEHTGGYATFANGGKRVKPYAILELVNSRGQLVYSRERDEPPPEQIVAPKVAGMLNQMLRQVVEAGTGGRARLDFTNVVGKTGTSSSWRDGWFMGFTGKYVTGVWLGNDNFSPTNHVTGGHLPAQTWQRYMSVAHKDLNIPTIPGLPMHPVQVAERQRLADLRKFDPSLGLNAAETAARKAASSLMPKSTRTALKTLAISLRKAGGLELPKEDPPAASPVPANPPKNGGAKPGAKPASKPPDRRAQTSPPSGNF